MGTRLKLKASAVTVVAAFLALSSWTSHAQNKPAAGFPGKPIRIFIGLAAGGGVDTITRAMAQRLGERTGVGVVVENVPGAEGVLAFDKLLAMPADGTAFMAGGSQIELGAVYKRVPYDLMKAFSPVVQMTNQPYLLVVNSKLPVRSVNDMVVLAKSRPPGELNYATAGVGSAGHLGHEMMNERLGIKMTHVPYKGSGASLADLLGGRVHLMFLSTLSAMTHVRSGALRPIGVSSLDRLDSLADVPTISESGVRDFEMSNNYGLFANIKAPAAVLQAVNREVSSVMNSAEMKDKLAADGAEPAKPHTPAQFRAGVEGRIKEWSAFVQAHGIKPE